MSGLKRTRPAGEPGPSCAGILKGMQAAEEEVKGESPKRQVGEIGKRAARCLRVAMRSIPAEYKKDGEKGVEGEQ